MRSADVTNVLNVRPEPNDARLWLFARQRLLQGFFSVAACERLSLVCIGLLPRGLRCAGQAVSGDLAAL